VEAPLRLIPMIRSHPAVQPGKLAIRRVDPGAEYEDIYPAESVHGLLHDRIHLRPPGHVGGLGNSRPAAFAISATSASSSA